MRPSRGLTLGTLALLLAVAWGAPALSDAPPAGILRRYDFAPDMDGWTAVEGAPVASRASGRGILELASARARSPDLPAEDGLRYVATFRLTDALATAEILDLRDASGARLVHLYTQSGKVWLEGAGVRQGFVLPPGTSWHRGEIVIEGARALGWFSTQAMGVFTNPVGPVARIESGSASDTILLDMVRVDRTPRVDDGLTFRSTFEALERVDTHPDSDVQYLEAEGFMEPGAIRSTNSVVDSPGEVDFLASAAPPGEYLVETAFSIRHVLPRPDGMAVIAGLPGTSGTATPVWSVTLDVDPTRGVGASTLTFNGPDGGRHALATFTDGDWHSVVAHADPASGRLRLLYDDALVLDTDVAGLASVERLAMGDVTEGLVPLAQRTGMPIEAYFDGGIPLALVDATAAP